MPDIITEICSICHIRLMERLFYFIPVAIWSNSAILYNYWKYTQELEISFNVRWQLQYFSFVRIKYLDIQLYFPVSPIGHYGRIKWLNPMECLCKTFHFLWILVKFIIFCMTTILTGMIFMEFYYPHFHIHSSW